MIDRDMRGTGGGDDGLEANQAAGAGRTEALLTGVGRVGVDAGVGSEGCRQSSPGLEGSTADLMEFGEAGRVLDTVHGAARKGCCGLRSIVRSSEGVVDGSELMGLCAFLLMRLRRRQAHAHDQGPAGSCSLFTWSGQKRRTIRLQSSASSILMGHRRALCAPAPLPLLAPTEAECPFE